MKTKDNLTQETQDHRAQDVELWLAGMTPKEREVANAIRKIVCHASRSPAQFYSNAVYESGNVSKDRPDLLSRASSAQISAICAPDFSPGPIPLQNLTFAYFWLPGLRTSPGRFFSRAQTLTKPYFPLLSSAFGPSTLNPQPSTLNPQPSTLNPQLIE
jgi:hypothetical protein